MIDPILSYLIDNEKGIEINTAGLTKGLKDANPCKDIIKRYRELGGEIITIGSDAHKPEDVGANFNDAKKLLIDAGFSHFNVFSGRKALEISI